MTIPSSFHSFPNDNHADDACTQTLPSGWTWPISWPSTKSFQMYRHVRYCNKKMKWEEMMMLVISTSTTSNHSKSAISNILQPRWYTWRRKEFEFISINLSQFQFPPFPPWFCSFILSNLQSIRSNTLQLD